MIPGKKKLIVIVLCAAFIGISCMQQKIKTPGQNTLSVLIPAYIHDSIYLSAVNPFTKEKAELGRYFFYDRMLSANNTKSCASCHDPKFSFTDGYKRSIGAAGDLHQRNARPLINIIFNKYLTAGDSSLHFPEDQINNPMFNNHPIELGWKGNENTILTKLLADTFYKKEMEGIYKTKLFTIANIKECISSFAKTITSFNSQYDQYNYLKKDVLSESEKSGMQLFFSDSLACKNCHGGINFSSPLHIETGFYHNTGLYNLNESGAYPQYDQGLYEKTRNQTDMGKFLTPTLRNLAFTAPYLHDGSAATLEDVLEVYENGGRQIKQGIYKGDGRKNPYKHPLIQGFSLNSQQRKDLIGFLLSLSDSTILTNPAYANPFSEDETTIKK